METLVGDVTNPEANRKKIFDGLDGDWFAISTLQPAEIDPAKLDLFCKPSSLGRIAVRVLNPYSFEATTAPASKTRHPPFIRPALKTSSVHILTFSRLCAGWELLMGTLFLRRRRE